MIVPLTHGNELKKIFTTTKTSRILHLESQFNEISFSNFPNVKAFCNELEHITTTFTNLGTTISDSRLAVQVLHGLTSEYRTFRSLVQHLNPRPSFDSIRFMLELEEHTNNKDKSPLQDSALVITQRPQNFEFLDHLNSRPNSNNHGGRPHRSHHFHEQQQHGYRAGQYHHGPRPNRPYHHGPSPSQ